MIEEGQSDQFLIERYVLGDKPALALLARRWHKIFCEKAYWIVRDKELSKDVAQECWIIIIRQLHTLEKPGSFKSWALRIVYTRAVDAYKKRRKEALNLARVEGGEAVQAESKEKDGQADLKKKLLEAIRDLPQEKQDIIRLFYVEEYSLKEISSFLEIPVGTVKSRLFKAREKLKTLIKS